MLQYFVTAVSGGRDPNAAAGVTHRDVTATVSAQWSRWGHEIMATVFTLRLLSPHMLQSPGDTISSF